MSDESIAINDYLAAKHDAEEEKPENRLKQVKEIVGEAHHSVCMDYSPERTKHLLEVALKCIDRHITEIKEEKE